MVPWIDDAGSLYSPQPVPTTMPPTSAPPCRADQIRADGKVSQNGGGGHLDQTFSFTNISSKVCLLSGVPLVTAKGAAGPPVVAGRGGFFVRTDTPSGDMAPGMTTELTLETNDDCAAATTSSGSSRHDQEASVTLGLPGGGTVRFPAALDVICGLYTSSFFVPLPAVQYRPPPWASLRLRLVLPASVKAGGTLSYEVDMLNPTDQTVVLDPCPSYAQGINRAGKTFLLLNCAPGPRIGAHLTVRYAMELAVPSGSAAGSATVYWAFAEPAGTAATGAVNIVRP